MEGVIQKQNASSLSHLVEVATALSELVDVPQAPTSDIRNGLASEGVVSSDDDDCRQKQAPTGRLKKREIFPQKLMEILSNDSLQDVISWLPHGRSFVIVRPDIFTANVLPAYLTPVDARTSTKYSSFTRKLNRWGFRQATKGPDTGAFHHPLFRRDDPDLCIQMVCQKSRERQASSRKSTPPKKRGLVEKGTSSNYPFEESRHTSLEASATSSVASVSADDRSVVSYGNSTTSSAVIIQENPKNLPTSIFSRSSEETASVPFISNDPGFVAKTLHERDEIEVLRAAKAMLYDSYIKALNGGEMKH